MRLHLCRTRNVWSVDLCKGWSLQYFLLKHLRPGFRRNQVIKILFHTESSDQDLRRSSTLKLTFSNASIYRAFTARIKGFEKVQSSDQSIIFTIKRLDTGCKCINRRYLRCLPLVMHLYQCIAPPPPLYGAIVGI